RERPGRSSLCRSTAEWSLGRAPERPLCIAQALPIAPQAGLELVNAFRVDRTRTRQSTESETPSVIICSRHVATRRRRLILARLVRGLSVVLITSTLARPWRRQSCALAPRETFRGCPGLP